MEDLSKFKAFADDNLNVAKIAKFVCDRVVNDVFKKLFRLGCQKSSFCGKELALSQTSPCFYMSAEHTSFENTVGKGEIARVFYPFGVLSTISIKYEIVACQLFQFLKICRFGKG